MTRRIPIATLPAGTIAYWAFENNLTGGIPA